MESQTVPATVELDFTEPITAPVELPPVVSEPPAKVEPEPVAGTVDTEPPDTEAKAADAERNADGTFKAKESKPKAKNDPQARINQALERQRLAEERASQFEAQLRAKAEIAAPKLDAPFPAFDAWSAQNPDRSYEDYIDARTDFRYEQRETARQQAEHVSKETQAQRQRFERYDQTIAAETEKSPGWLDQIDPELRKQIPISAVPKDYTNAIDKDGNRYFQPYYGHILAEAITRSDNPVGLLKHFTAHPEDNQRLSSLPPDKFFIAFGKIEAKVESTMDAAPQPGPAPIVTVSTAKPPIKPVGSSPHSADPLDVSDDLSTDEHIRRMNLRDAKVRRGQ